MQNIEKYKQLTARQDWKGICELNGVPVDVFGTKKEIKVLPKYLEKDEIVLALTSGIVQKNGNSNSSDFGANTWLVVLTSERFLFLDCALLTDSVDTQTVRLERVLAVSASQGWVLGKVIVDIGSRSIVIDNCVKSTVSAVADMANKWLSFIAKSKSEASMKSVATSQLPPVESELDKLEKLGRLYQSGLLTEAEFNSAKLKVLESL